VLAVLDTEVEHAAVILADGRRLDADPQVAALGPVLHRLAADRRGPGLEFGRLLAPVFDLAELVGVDAGDRQQG